MAVAFLAGGYLSIHVLGALYGFRLFGRLRTARPGLLARSRLEPGRGSSYFLGPPTERLCLGRRPLVAWYLAASRCATVRQRMPRLPLPHHTDLT